jgi:alpha-beta hydrolase superfamily lysophospholipase
VYRVRAGYPHRHPPVWTPDAVGLAYEEIEIPSSDGLRLPGWYLPAGPAARPGVVLVHGWESARDRTIPHAQILHAAGFHVLTFDVRGNGANGPEALPMSVGEYAADTRAAVAELRRHPEVTSIGLLGHSMGAAGALVAAADDDEVEVVVAVATPADPYRLTRQTFRLARLPIPAPIAWPLAWLTTRVFLQPRGHTVDSVSATSAVRAIAVPVLLAHGSDDGVVPFSDLARLAAARRAARPGAVTETLLVEGGRHSWLYEFPEYRAAIARFLTTSLGGPFTPDEAAEVAAAVPVERLPDPERLTTLDEEPGGFRSLSRVLRRQESAGSTTNGAPAAEATATTPRTPADGSGDDMAAALPDPAATIPG